jgi:NADH-quinone oxidoreductase subunit H
MRLRAVQGWVWSFLRRRKVRKYVLGVIMPGAILGIIAVLIAVFGVVKLDLIPYPDSWPSGLTTFINNLLAALIVALIGALPVVLLTWMERKVVARIQERIGPNVHGPWGMIVALADAVKMFTKEDTTPAGADRLLFNAAPILMAMMMWMLFGILPFSKDLIGVDLSVALLYALALGSVSTIAVLVAGWASNNKYALLGAFRTVAQLIAYEIPQALALIAPIMLAGTMSTVGIIEQQDVAYIFALPVSALIFFISSVAETARTPFDLLEADSEIIAGFHIEYSGMKFALFFIAEYGNMFAVSMLTTVVFLGGYRFFGLEEIAPFLQPVIIIAKALLVVFIFLWLRGTLPRVRIDHLLAFNWKFMVPLALVNVTVVAILAKLLQDAEATSAMETIVLLAANLVMIVGVYAILTYIARRARRQEGAAVSVEPLEPEPAAAH